MKSNYTQDIISSIKSAQIQILAYLDLDPEI